MKRHISALTIAIVLLIKSTTTFAVSSNDTVEIKKTSITDITVFKEGAEINREARISLDKGKSTLLITNLENGIDPKSIRITVPSSEIISTQQIAEVEFDERILEIDDKVELYKDQIKENNIKLSLYQTKLSVIENSIDKYTRVPSVNDIKERLNLLDAEFEKLNLAVFEIEEESKSLLDSIRINMTKRAKLIAQNEKNTTAILVEVLSEKKQEVDVNVNFLSHLAKWKSHYNYKLDKNDNSTSLEKWVTIYQNTGIDWQNINLSISSYSPTNELNDTKMDKWFIDRVKSKHKQKRYSTLVGKAINDKTSKPVSFVKVKLTNEYDKTIAKAVTDEKGNFTFQNLEKGSYKVLISSTGYMASTKETDIRAGLISPVIIRVKEKKPELEKAMKIGEFEVVDYKVPLIERDNTTSNMAQTVGGVYSQDGDANIRGARSDENYYFIDGVKVSTGKLYESEKNSFISLKDKYTIVSSSEKRIKVQTDTLKTETELLAIPDKNEFSIITSKIPNWQSTGLKTGDVINIFYGNRFNGMTLIDKSFHTSDTLQLTVGEFKSVPVSKKVSTKRVSKGLIKNKRQTTSTITLTVKNTSDSPVIVDLKDQYPLAKNEEIEIELVESGNADVDKDKGILSWEVTLQPNETKEYNFKYTVEYPPNYSY